MYGLIVRIMNRYPLLFAHPVYLNGGDVVSTVRTFGILDSNRDRVARISEIAGNLDALQCLILFVEHEAYRVTFGLR